MKTNLSVIFLLIFANIFDGTCGHKGYDILDSGDRFRQKSIGRYKSQARTTQAPIGNIVYQTDDDDNQSNYERHDVSNIDDDIRLRKSKYSQSNTDDNDNDEVEFNNQRHKVLKTIIDLRDIHDDDDDGDTDVNGQRTVKHQKQKQPKQVNEKQERERYPVVYPSATGNLMQRPTEMTHKNWGTSTHRKHRKNHKSLHRYKMALHRTMKSYNQQQHKPKFRSGFHKNVNRKPYIQAHIHFYDSSDGDEDALKLNKYQVATSKASSRQYKWPNLSRLQSQLQEDMADGDLPPYIKKYNRRNKQLINLLEGTISPNYSSDYHKKQSQRRQKNTNKWLEKYLFEEQKPMKSLNQPKMLEYGKYGIGKDTQSEPNALPGEDLTVSSDLEEYDDNMKKPISDKMTIRQPLAEQHSNQTTPTISPTKTSHKRDQFLFHRVAAPKLVGMGAIDFGARKQRLPFVAITDKRVGEVKQRLDNTQANVPTP